MTNNNDRISYTCIITSPIMFLKQTLMLIIMFILMFSILNYYLNIMIINYADNNS